VKEILKDFNGQFLNTVFNFLIIGSVIFLVLRQATNLQRKPSAAPVAPTTKDWAFCCTPIPVAAERCPNCTSQLQSLEAAAQ
jgi:large conductance mechanosensitive channel